MKKIINKETILLIIIFNLWLAILKLIKSEMDWMLPVLLVISFLYSLYFLINIFSYLRFLKKPLDFNKMREELLLQKESIKNNYYAFNKSMSRTVTSSYIFIYLFIIFNMFILTMLIKLFSIFLLPYIIVLGLVIFVIYYRFSILPDILDTENCLKKEKYPHLVSFIKSVAKEVGIKNKINIFIVTEINCYIFYQNSAINLSIGLTYLKMLNKNELKAVLIHEFAHYLNYDLHQNNRNIKCFDRLCGDRNIKFFNHCMNIFLWPLLRKFNEKFFRYSTIYEIHKEISADKKVKESGYSQDFINATAKAEIYSIYFGEPGCYNLFELEEPITNYNARIYEEFINLFDRKKEFWTDIILKQIPPQIGTHPTLPERMKNLDISSFTLIFAKADKDFEEEINNCFYEFDEKLKNDLKSNYEELRKTNYLKPKNSIETYEQQNDIESELNLIEIALCYEKLFKFSDAENIYNKIITLNPDNYTALYGKGCIMLSQYNDQGIDYIKRAIAGNSNYIEEGIEKISLYLLKMGLAEKKDQLLEWKMNLINYYANVVSEFYIFRNSDKIEKLDLSDDIVNEIKNFFISQELIRKIYIVKKIIADKDYCYLVGTYIDSSENEIIEDYNYKIFRYLDSRDEQFSLFMLNNDFKTEKLFKKRNGEFYIK